MPERQPYQRTDNERLPSPNPKPLPSTRLMHNLRRYLFSFRRLPNAVQLFLLHNHHTCQAVARSSHLNIPVIHLLQIDGCLPAAAAITRPRWKLRQFLRRNPDLRKAGRNRQEGHHGFSFALQAV